MERWINSVLIITEIQCRDADQSVTFHHYDLHLCVILRLTSLAYSPDKKISVGYDEQTKREKCASRLPRLALFSNPFIINVSHLLTHHLGLRQ